MQRRHSKAVQVLGLSAGLAMAGVVVAVPAQADTNTDAFITALTNAGLGAPDPASVVALGQSVCPMLADSGQTTADVAAKVADTAGMPLGAATTFTGLAISVFCPATLARIGSDASSLLPPPIPGF